MKTIIVISPDYLESCFKEAQDFSFCMQGYGNFEMANNRLMYTNAQDILGFAYVCEEMPKSGSKKYKQMLKFFDNCNLMQANLKFVIVTQGNIGSVLKDLKQFKFLRFAYKESVEYITDTVLRRDVFGSILIDVYNPYEEIPTEVKDFTGFDCPRLSFRPIVPDTLFLVASTVRRLDTLKETIDNDVILLKYGDNEIVALLRQIFIIHRFGEDCEKLINQFYKKVVDLDDTILGLYRGFLDMILGGDFDDVTAN